MGSEFPERMALAFTCTLVMFHILVLNFVTMCMYSLTANMLTAGALQTPSSSFIEQYKGKTK